MSMASTQKCIRIENELLEAMNKAREDEHLDFAPFVKRAMWTYLEKEHPETAAEAKEKLRGSSS